MLPANAILPSPFHLVVILRGLFPKVDNKRREFVPRSLLHSFEHVVEVAKPLVVLETPVTPLVVISKPPLIAVAITPFDVCL